LDQDKIDLLRLLIGDVPSSPFYQLFTDEDLQKFLDMAGGDVMKAARYAAISASFQLSGWATRERTGDIEVWNSVSTSYLAALKYLTDAQTGEIPNGMMPWAAGLSRAEACAMARNPDLIQSNLLTIYQCDDPCSWSCGC
jgi:hypothetical protein